MTQSTPNNERRTQRLNNHWLITGLTMAMVFSPIWMLALI